MTKFLAWLGALPTTQARVGVTLALALGTAIRYWAGGGWEPSWEWLTFIAAMSGLDVTQFGVKRGTDATYVAAKAGTRPASGDTT